VRIERNMAIKERVRRRRTQLDGGVENGEEALWRMMKKLRV